MIEKEIEMPKEKQNNYTLNPDGWVQHWHYQDEDAQRIIDILGNDEATPQIERTVTTSLSLYGQEKYRRPKGEKSKNVLGPGEEARNDIESLAKACHNMLSAVNLSDRAFDALQRHAQEPLENKLRDMKDKIWGLQKLALVWLREKQTTKPREEAAMILLISLAKIWRGVTDEQARRRIKHEPGKLYGTRHEPYGPFHDFVRAVIEPLVKAGLWKTVPSDELIKNAIKIVKKES